MSGSDSGLSADGNRDRLEGLFAQAMVLPPDQQERFVVEATAGSPGLRGELLSLLAHTTPDLGLLDRPVSEVSSALREDGVLPPGARFGKYRIIRLIGQGGAACVYEAQQEHPDRLVGLKLMHRGLFSAATLRRLEFEVDVLAKLNHPDVAAIYDAGVLNDGRGPQPYFAMELVRGNRLDEYMRRLPELRDRLRLLERVARAVQHAHQKGIVHRDLKPANILVTSEGDPKVLDFGVARTTDATDQERTLEGMIVGTPQYMAPEQAEGRARDVDFAADVYALGMIAFEALTGTLPYDLKNVSILKALRLIQTAEAPRLGSVNQALRGEVEAIVGKAMEKERARRYANAGELAADLRRFLNDEPITACAPTAIYQLRKFAARHRALAAGAAATVFALMLGVAGTSWQAARAAAAQRAADEHMAAAVRQQQRAEAMGFRLLRLGQDIQGIMETSLLDMRTKAAAIVEQRMKLGNITAALYNADAQVDAKDNAHEKVNGSLLGIVELDRTLEGRQTQTEQELKQLESIRDALYRTLKWNAPDGLGPSGRARPAQPATQNSEQ